LDEYAHFANRERVMVFSPVLWGLPFLPLSQTMIMMIDDGRLFGFISYSNECHVWWLEFWLKIMPVAPCSYSESKEREDEEEHLKKEGEYTLLSFL
jgi:hypothetical protein